MANLLRLLLLWMIAAAASAASADEISILRNVAAALGVPSTVWNLDSDPCQDKWMGISCCSPEDLQSACCTTHFNPDMESCDDSANSTIVAVNLDYNYIKLKRLDGFLPQSICNLTSLTTLDLNNNHLGGQIPSCIGDKLSQLRMLGLAGSNLTGRIPEELSKLSYLQLLYLDINALSGPIPRSLGNLQSLQQLYLRGNELSGPIPSELGRLKNLTDLELQRNRLNGSLPRSLASLTKLQTLKLFNNDLAGVLNLSTFHNMSNLVALDLHLNNFVGSTPAFDEQLANLSQLDLGFNQLSGGIPDSLGRLPSLTELFLGHNKLSGSIPATLASSKGLTILDISHNSLTGSLQNLPQIQVDLSFNFFDIGTATLNLLQQGRGSYFNCISSSTNASCLRSLPGQRSSFTVNAGSTQDLRDNDGNLFQADATSNTTGLHYIGEDANLALELSGEKGGTILNRLPSGIQRIPVEDNPSLYQSMRWSSFYMAYHGSSLQNGTYDVTLYFAETVFRNASYRVFDVVLQGEVVAKNLDVVKEVGAFTAYKLRRNVTVTDGTLSVEFINTGPDRYLDPKDYPLVQTSGPMVSAVSVRSFNPVANGSSSTWKLIPILVSIGCLALLILFFMLYRKRSKSKAGAMNGLSWTRSEHVGLTAYTYKELSDATQGFNPKLKLGQGGFGIVHKGYLNGNHVIAVKQLTQQTQQSREAFKKELEILSSVQHRNLLAVRGYCLDADFPMIVCDYMPNGSLDQLLYEGGTGFLTWEQRRKIAVDTALGLAYLHDESKHRIIHCDVKPANILLDTNFHPRIADFGVARLYEDGKSHVTATRMGGTVGYLAPEYVMHYQLSDKVDVYSFGVVLLELISAHRAVDTSVAYEEVVLVEWAHKLASDSTMDLSKLLDKRLEGKCEMKEVIDMASIAVLCTQETALLRPKMRNVWLMLNGTVEIPELTKLQQPRFDTVRALMAAYEHSSTNSAERLIISPR